MKNFALILIFLLQSTIFFGQTLATYGDQKITRAEFLSAFRKNNQHTRATEKAYRDYLNLYINYRLKVQAAYDMKLDSLPGQLSELQNFKGQIIDQYITDETSLNQMAKEAFDRSQHDLRISYIFVAASKNASPTDTAKAWLKIQQAYKDLKSNKDFSETALLYSEDPFVKNNKSDIGYITVFDLPYVMETVAYNTATGKYSPVFRTDGGYIILKKTGERPALGRIRAAQILLVFPIDANDAARAETHARADSLYKAIRAGADFGELARKFSGDNLSFQLGGVLPEFGIGKYEAGFEQTAFGLKKDGDVSEPLASSFGYHIIKRNSRIPVPKIADQKVLNNLKEKIKGDPRIIFSRKQMLQTILKRTGFKEFIPAGNNFWEYTDSLILNKPAPARSGIDEKAVLFQFPGKSYLIGDWIVYRKGLRSSPHLTNGKTNAEILDGYRQVVAFEYYKQHLERYNPAFAAQVTEFRDGNLLFEVMQREIWNRASSDSAGLRNYFDSHTKDFWWKPGAEAIIFSSASALSINQLQKDLGKEISGWRKWVDEKAGQVQADSGRFEMSQIPGGSNIQPGRFTGPLTNAEKNTQTAYIIKEYKSPSPRTFDEARGLVLNDYQNELEKKWIGQLKKKYPVRVDETVFKSLPK